MKKALLFFSLCFCLATASNAQVTFGVGGTYVNDLGVQARANLDLTETIGLIPSFSYYFSDPGTVISLDANATYNLTTIGDDMPLYGLAGLDYTRVSFAGASDSEIGLNVGAGTNIGNIYAEIFYRTTYSGDIGINVGYTF